MYSIQLIAELMTLLELEHFNTIGRHWEQHAEHKNKNKMRIF